MLPWLVLSLSRRLLIFITMKIDREVLYTIVILLPYDPRWRLGCIVVIHNFHGTTNILSSILCINRPLLAVSVIGQIIYYNSVLIWSFLLAFYFNHFELFPSYAIIVIKVRPR